MGRFRSPADKVPPGSPLAAHHLSCLGNPDRTAPLVVSFDPLGELARNESGSPAVPGWVPAPLPGHACLSRHLSNLLDSRGCDCLCSESCVLRLENLERSTPVAPSLLGLTSLLRSGHAETTGINFLRFLSEKKPGPRRHQVRTFAVEGYKDSRRRLELCRRCSPGHTTGRALPGRRTASLPAGTEPVVRQPCDPNNTRPSTSSVSLSRATTGAFAARAAFLRSR